MVSYFGFGFFPRGPAQAIDQAGVLRAHILLDLTDTVNRKVQLVFILVLQLDKLGR